MFADESWPLANEDVLAGVVEALDVVCLVMADEVRDKGAVLVNDWKLVDIKVEV